MKNKDKRLIDFLKVLKQYIEDIPNLIHLWRLGLGAVYAINNVDPDQIQQNSNNEYFVTETKTVIKHIENEENKPDHKWLSGFYFNAAIMRIAVFYERTLKTLLFNEKCKQCNKQLDDLIRKTNLNINDLKKGVKDKFFSSTNGRIPKWGKLLNIIERVNDLKHDIHGYPLDKIKPVDVFEAFEELTNLLKNEDVKEYLKQTYKDNG